MIQAKTFAMTEVARTLRISKRRGMMKRFLSFVSKISDLFYRISDVGWLILILILFIIIFILCFLRDL